MAFHIEDSDAVSVEPGRTPATTTQRQFFQNGNPHLGKFATVVTGEFLNQLQNEILNAVVRSGQTPDKMNDHQLTLAIRRLGIPVWSEHDDYTLPALVWGSDFIPYVALKPSGPGTPVADGSTLIIGPKDPTNPVNTGADAYWMALGEYLLAGGGLPLPLGEDGTVLTVTDKEAGEVGWRMASVPQNEMIFESSGTFTAPADGFYEITCVGGGGGGGGGYVYFANGGTSIAAYAGGAGASGYVKAIVVYLQKGVTYSVIIGAGGPGGDGLVAASGTSTPGTRGGETVFGDSLVVALGGGPGTGASTQGAVTSEDGSVRGGIPGQVTGTGQGVHSRGPGNGYFANNKKLGYGLGGNGGSATGPATATRGEDGGDGYCSVRW